LRRIIINGKRYKEKLLSDSGSLVFSQEDQITLEPGETLKINLRFGELNNTDADAYAFKLTEKMLTTNSRFKFDAKNRSIKWSAPVDGNYDEDIEKVLLTFPEESRKVKKIIINGEKSDFKEKDDGFYELDDAEIDDDDKTLELEVEYENLTSSNPSDFSALLYFENGETMSLQANDTNIVQGKNRDTFFPTLVRADKLHDMGLTGRGIGVAIVDTGSSLLKEIEKDTDGDDKKIVYKDLISKKDLNKDYDKEDGNGHGTHVTSIIANSSKTVRYNDDGVESYNGIAPNADLIIVRAFDELGASTYTRVLESIEYAIEHKDRYNIRVLNLSFSALPTSYYWDDPLNQLVMRAWQEGIVVVAAAGNRGSGAMSVGVPGNTPYIITVGAASDNATPFDMNDDFVPTFSSAGPTVEGFIKPELVAPGSRIQGLIAEKTFIRDHFSMFDNDPFDEHDYFELSGTSQSTAVISGIVALMLENDPLLTPDEVKCRLMDTARIATLDEQTLAFSVFQQGLGLVDAYNAIYSTANDCIDQTMSIAKELDGEEHYIGPVRLNEVTGEFEIIGAEGLEWNGVYNDSQLWRKGRFNSDSQLWGNRSFNSDSQLWRHTSGGFRSNSQLWRHTSFNTDSQLWGNQGFDVNSQLWGNRIFNADSQLWGNGGLRSNSSFEETEFGSSSIQKEWTDHE